MDSYRLSRTCLHLFLPLQTKQNLPPPLPPPSLLPQSSPLNKNSATHTFYLAWRNLLTPPVVFIIAGLQNVLAASCHSLHISSFSRHILVTSSQVPGKLFFIASFTSRDKLTRTFPSRTIPTSRDIVSQNNNAVFTLGAGPLARSQYPEGPVTSHLDTGFSWFPCVYKQMLRWFPRLQVATTCFLCSLPNLNLLVTNFIFCIHVI